MQGFILKLTKSIKEDMIVKILTTKHYYTLYRFYGARHNILYTGRKIDFEIEHQGIHLPKLRNIMHLARNYEKQLERVYVWQQFCNLLDRHLQDTKEIDQFYYNLLNQHSKILEKQNPKRLVSSAYVKLLEFEGRLYHENICFICGNTFQDKVAITQGLLLACLNCVTAPVIMNKKDILDFYETKSLINISDSECTKIYNTILLGL
ncbi:recombination protein RecO [Helicobacter didelphidarum]|uniref:Recombination protein RecO n=1 Tax=Helicobacter didelphidarum TaxID=2040648 RepID=A0A3D8IL61_9HELI|nr:recombination protein RecO [Helicobacter didelphidarum]RDU65364.1 recombination protein RecO [Helicobacter didelphidarum]